MIATIRIKDLLRYLATLILIIGILLLFTRFFLSKKNDENTNKICFGKISKPFFSCIDLSIPASSLIYSNKEDTSLKKIITSREGLTRIVDLELINLNSEKKQEYKKEEENKNSDEDEPNNSDKKEEKIQINDTYTNEYNGVKVKNLTDIKLTESILKPDFSIQNKKNIIIFHTHTCESYTQTDKNQYNPSGNFRTTDLNYSVARVGEELKSELEKYNFKVVHDDTKHDYPAYTGSYSRSLETVKKLLDNQNNIEIVFDVHRDAVGNKSSYAPTVEIDGEKVAQIMFVIGTNDGGGNHPNWKNNLKFAVAIQEKANEMYPGLFRAINLRSATFNQKVSNAASIIEVGATGNTLEEATGSMKYLAKIMNEVLK